jgi:hypothetical protein
MSECYRDLPYWVPAARKNISWFFLYSVWDFQQFKYVGFPSQSGGHGMSLDLGGFGKTVRRVWGNLDVGFSGKIFAFFWQNYHQLGHYQSTITVAFGVSDCRLGAGTIGGTLCFWSGSVPTYDRRGLFEQAKSLFGGSEDNPKRRFQSIQPNAHTCPEPW